MVTKKALTYEQRIEAAAKKELKAEKKVSVPDILASALPHQKAFILDEHKRKALCGTRRSSKSFAIALLLIYYCLHHPKSKCGYLGLTDESAKQTMWTDIFETIFIKYDIKANMKSDQIIRFPNGAQIFVRGWNAKPAQMGVFRGQAFDVLAVDECQDAEQDLEALFDKVFGPAMAQRAGTMVALGTPGDRRDKHYWWRINDPNNKENLGWKLFRMEWKDNTSVDPISGLRICDSLKEKYDKDIERTNGLICETEAYRQEVLGEWVTLTTARIYRFEKVRNCIKTLPAELDVDNVNFRRENCVFILGLDFGFSPDPNAFVIMAYNLKFSNNLYVIRAFSKGEIETQEVANIIKRLDKQYHFDYIVADGGGMGKQSVNDLNTTYGLWVQSADKYGKLAHQNTINSDFITRDILIYEPDCKNLIYQLETVVWNRMRLIEGDKVEDKKFDNHESDALLYGHFYSRHQWFKAKVERHVPTSKDLEDEMKSQVIDNTKKMFQAFDWAIPNVSNNEKSLPR